MTSFTSGVKVIALVAELLISVLYDSFVVGGVQGELVVVAVSLNTDCFSELAVSLIADASGSWSGPAGIEQATESGLDFESSVSNGTSCADLVISAELVGTILAAAQFSGMLESRRPSLGSVCGGTGRVDCITSSSREAVGTPLAAVRVNARLLDLRGRTLGGVVESIPFSKEGDLERVGGEGKVIAASILGNPGDSGTNVSRGGARVNGARVLGLSARHCWEVDEVPRPSRPDCLNLGLWSSIGDNESLNPPSKIVGL